MTPTRNLLRLLGVLGLLLSTASCSSPTLRSETLQPRLARLDTRAGETIRGEKLLERPAVLAFYAARKSQPAWNLDAGAASIREAIEGMAKDGLDPADYHRARIDSLIALRAARRSEA